MPIRKKAGRPKAPIKKIIKRKMVKGAKRPPVKGRRKVNRGPKMYSDKVGFETLPRSVVGGKKAKQTLKGAWKVIKANSQRNTYSFAAVNRYMSPTSNAQSLPGATGIGTIWSGSAVGNGTVYLPLHLYSLTAAPNVNGGVVSNPQAQWGLRRDSSSSAYINFGGNGQWGFQNVAGSNSSSGASYPGQSDLLKAFSAKMVLYGTLSRPTRYRIDLIQLSENWLHPDWLVSTASGQGAQSAQALAFWEELHRTYSYSPAVFTDANATKGKIKYLKSWTHTIGAKLSNEPGVDTGATTAGAIQTENIPCAHSHCFNIFHRFNRKQSYDWDQQSFLPESVGQTDQQIPITLGQNQNDVTYRARIYLMVRALAPSHSLNGLSEATISPSYDIAIRTYHENFG